MQISKKILGDKDRSTIIELVTLFKKIHSPQRSAKCVKRTTTEAHRVCIKLHGNKKVSIDVLININSPLLTNRISGRYRND